MTTSQTKKYDFWIYRTVLLYNSTSLLLKVNSVILDKRKSPLIFISYRRTDSNYPAVTVHDRLVSEYGKNSIFIDVDSIHPGTDFPSILQKTLSKCQIMLVLIGDRWLTATDTEGNHKLDNPSDFVRLEIETALKSNIIVIPVLLNNVSIPPKTELPKEIQDLSNKQALMLRPGSDFNTDLNKLLLSINQHLASLGFEYKKTDSESGTLEQSIEKHNLLNSSASNFGQSVLCENLVHINGFEAQPLPAENIVVFLANPSERTYDFTSDFLRNSTEALKHWADAKPGPKYFPPNLFEIPRQRHASSEQMIWEEPFGQNPREALFRLMVTKYGEISYANSVSFVRHLKNQVTVFRIGKIFAELWKFVGLVCELYSISHYSGSVDFCLAMTKTKGTHLADLADNWLEPYDAFYWSDVNNFKIDLSTQSSNLIFRAKFDTANIQAKEQPDFIKPLARDVALAFNQDNPRFLEKATGEIPKKYF